MNIHNLGSQIKKAHLSWTELSWSQWQQQREKTYLALTRELKKKSREMEALYSKSGYVKVEMQISEIKSIEDLGKNS